MWTLSVCCPQQAWLLRAHLPTLDDNRMQYHTEQFGVHVLAAGVLSLTDTTCFHRRHLVFDQPTLHSRLRSLVHTTSQRKAKTIFACDCAAFFGHKSICIEICKASEFANYLQSVEHTIHDVTSMVSSTAHAVAGVMTHKWARCVCIHWSRRIASQHAHFTTHENKDQKGEATST